MSFDESSNNWTYYAPYSVTIDFDSIDFGSDNDSCSTFLDTSTFASNDAGIVNLNKFKIQSFNDNWSFTFDENDSFARVRKNELGESLNFNNTSFGISYNISAVGRHYYDYDTPATNSSAKLLPSWEQAKNFVQYRLHTQVTNLIRGILKNNYLNGCDYGEALSLLNTPGGSNGLLSNLANSDSGYGIYNEQITCELSESEGSFSATYDSIVKSHSTNTSYGSAQTKHTVKKSNSVENSTLVPVRTISVEGTIEGLIEGGIINSPKPISLPNKGHLFIHGGATYTSKYENALSVLNKIYSSTDYNGGVGVAGKRDLKAAYKNLLGVTLSELQTGSNPDDPIPDAPHPVSFNVTHDYLNGTINYSAEYSSITNTCGQLYKEISIETTMPTKVIAIFNIPNSESCPIIQDLATYTARTVNITVQGVDTSEAGQPTELNLNSLINCGSCFSFEYFPITIPDGAIISNQSYTHNPLDGTFTANLSYICSEGCDI